MKVRLEQSLKQTQSLNMTQEMRMSIELLQKNSLDLREFLIEELSANPYLEVEEWGDEYDGSKDVSDGGDNSQDALKALGSEDGEGSAVEDLKTDDSYGNMSDLLAEFDWNSYKDNSGNSFGDTHVRKKNDYDTSDFTFEDMLTAEDSLPEKLNIQISSTNFEDDIKKIMVYMSYNLDSMGFLRDADEEIAQELEVPLDMVEFARDELRYIEPLGVGCSGVKDYLRFMFLEARVVDIPEDTKETLQKLISSEDHLETLMEKEYEKLCNNLKIKKENLINMLGIMKSIPPFPAFGFEDFTSETVVPDIHVYLLNDEIIIELENKFIPTVRLNKDIFDTEISEIKNKKTKEFMKERYRAAEWIVKSLSERNKTLYQVAASIFTHQKSFLEFGEDFLKPLTLKDVSEDIERHQSTVSRLTNGKYAVTPHGIYELKAFFVKKVNENVPTTNRHLESKIIGIIENENKKKPLSDEDIAHLLSREGIDVARRTIAKYRAKLKIASARVRKRDYEFSVGGK